MDNDSVYLRSLNAYNYRHGKENPRILEVVRRTPKNLPSRPCFMVIYESDNKIDYVACSEIMERNWEFI